MRGEIKVRGAIAGRGKPVDIVIANGRIASVTPAGPGRPDFGSARAIVAPPLFDAQVNGIQGIDLQRPDVGAEDLAAVTGILADNGVGRWVPTIITGPLDAMEHACRTIAAALQDKALARAIPGIHLEGPFISPVDGPRGAHAREYVREPDVKVFDRLFKAAAGKVLYVTLAPELKRADTLIKAIVARGVAVALGHHAATAGDIARAVDAGARLCTHLGNGLASQLHRHLNPLWPQLADDRLAAGLIADLQHLPPEVLKTFVRAKGPRNVMLVSDCVHVAGMPPGDYALGNQPVRLLPSGRICLKGTDLLAGSSLLLLQGVVNAVANTDLSMEQALDAATVNPARLLGRTKPAPIREGQRAELIVFDVHRGIAAIRAAVIAGRLFYR